MRRILSLFLLTLLGVMVGFAAETAYKTLTFPDDNSSKNKQSSYVNEWKATIGSDSWTIQNFNNNNWNWAYIKCGRKDNASIGHIITDAPIDKAITKVVVTIDAFTSGKVNSMTLEVATDDAFSQNLQTITGEIATGDVTFVVPTATVNCYYRLNIDCASGSNNGLVTVSKLQYLINAEGGDQPAEVATPAITVASSFEEGADETLSISCATAGATIYYSIAKGDDYLVESEEYDGAVDLSGYEAGEYAVEAFAMLDDETSDIAEATFTITEPAGPAGSTATFGPDFSASNWTVITAGEDYSWTKDGATLLIEKSGSSTSTSQGLTNGHLRIYKSAQITISGSAPIESIQFTVVSGYNLSDLTPSIGTIEGAKWIPTGDVNSVTFVAGAQVRMSEILVTFKEKEVDPYVATPVITVKSQFEKGAHESLSISCATAGAYIVFGIDKDGQSVLPGPFYEGPIDLSEYEVGEYSVSAYAELNKVISGTASATFTITEPAAPLTSLAQVQALETGTEFTFGAKTAVLGRTSNKRNLFIVDLDNTAGLMVDAGSGNTWSNDYVFGTAIGSGWSGKKAIYNGQPEATNTQDFNIDGTAEVQPLSIEAADVTAENYGRYAVIENATVAAGGTIEGYTLYNQLGIDMANVAAGTYNVYGIIGLYKQTLQFWPMRYEPIEDPTFVAAPTITVTPQFGVGADEAIFIDCATEGATIYYEIQKGNEILVQYTEYESPIDLSQYEAGEYTVVAYAVNGDYESETTSATFTVTEPAEAVEYQLVTSTDDLQGGDFVIFSSGHAAGLGANGDGIKSGFTFNGDKVEVETEDILVLSIVPVNAEGEGKFAIMHGEKYMFLAPSASAPTFTSDDEPACLIEIKDGIATIKGETATTRALIYRGGSYNIFKNYAEGNVGGDYEKVQIFKKVEQQEEGMTLAEVLELEEPANVNLTTDLGIQKRIGANAWAFDSNDNWIRLKFADEDAAEQAVDYANIHNLKGAYNGDYKDPEFTVTSFESSEESLEANIWEINLEQGFEEMPTPGQIVQVTGYYQSGGTLRGWSNLRGTSLTLANDFTDVHEFAMDDMENVFVGALYRNVEVAIQYKGDMPANGAPRRISPAEVDYDFQNLVGQLTENSMPVPSDIPTGVKTVEGAKEVKSVKYVNTVGQISDRAFDGVNVMITTYTDGTTNTVKVVK